MDLKEELVELEKKRVEIKQKLAAQKKYNKENAGRIRKERDAKLEITHKVLKNVNAIIFAYNKLGKAKKAEFNILAQISKIIGSTEESISETVEPEEADQNE